MDDCKLNKNREDLLSVSAILVLALVTNFPLVLFCAATFFPIDGNIHFDATFHHDGAVSFCSIERVNISNDASSNLTYHYGNSTLDIKSRNIKNLTIDV